MWRTTDRQMTDHTMEKWVAVGKITCIKAMLPNNNNLAYLHCVQKKTPTPVSLYISMENFEIFTKFSGNV